MRQSGLVELGWLLLLLCAAAIAIACSPSDAGLADEVDDVGSATEQAAQAISDFGTIDLETLHQQEEELIRDCMALEGFDYEPVPADSPAVFFGPDTSHLTDRERAEQFGYGLGEIYRAMATQFREEQTIAALEALGDPGFDVENQSESAAWELAFWGTSTTDGCKQSAFDTAFNDQLVLEEMSVELDEMWARMAADPRFVTAESNWSACMAAAGVEASRFGDTQQTLEAAYETFAHEAGLYEGEVVSVKTSDGTEHFVQGPPQLADIQYAELALLEDDERRIATADQICLETVDADLAVVSDEHTKTFIEQNERRKAAILDG